MFVEMVILSCASCSDLQIFTVLYYYGWKLTSSEVMEVTYLDSNIRITFTKMHEDRCGSHKYQHRKHQYK